MRIIYQHTKLYIILVTFISLSGCAVNKDSTPAFIGVKNGQYQHYHFISEDNEFILSMLKLSDYALTCRLFDLKNRTSVVGEFHFYRDPNNQYIMTPKSYKGNPSEEQLGNLFAHVSLIALVSSGIPEYPLTKNLLMQTEDPNTGEMVECEFANWIPLFELLSLNSNTAPSSGVGLVALGFYNSGKSDLTKLFFIEELPHGEKGISLKLKVIKPKSVQLGNIKMQLDDNWTFKGKQSDAGLPHETYWIEQGDTRIAQIGVEVYTSKKEVDNLKQNYYHFIGLTELALVNETRVEASSLGTRVRFTMVDSVTGVENYIVFDICSMPDGTARTLSFSCLKSVYEENHKYFNDILDSAKLSSETIK